MQKIILSNILLLFLSFYVLPSNAGVGTEHKDSSDEFSDQKILAEFKIAKGEDILLLPVTFKGKELLFIFDTGCSWVAFDASFKNVLGDVKRTEEASTHGKEPKKIEIFAAPEVFLGPLSMQECEEVCCVDLQKVSLILGKKVSGIIGMNFLRKHTVQIDFDKDRLAFLKSKTNQGIFSLLRPKKKHNWGEKLPIKYNSGGIPHIKGNVINGGKTYFMIDTGASITKCLEDKIFENFLKHRQIKSSKESGQNVSFNTQPEEIRIDQLMLGSLKYEGLIFNKSKMSFLGTPFLSRHIVTFDFPNNAIYLKKGEDFKRVDEADMTGLHLMRVLSKTVVHSVDEGSPAQKAGIKPKDVILKINGKDAETYSRWEISQLKKSADKHKLTLTIKRGDNVKEVSFLLEKKI